MRRIAAVAAITTITTVLTLVSALPASAFDDRDCGDFATREQAQAFFLAAGSGDPHRLDLEGDGIACESLPSSASEAGSVTEGTAARATTGLAATARGTVVKVIDGDTIDVRVAGARYRIRILGIDTPEVRGTVECGGRSASKAMRKQLRAGDAVKLTADRTQDDVDRYGRALRYVSERGVDVGLKLIRAGWAAPYIYQNNPFRRADAYLAAASKAQRGARGVWSSCGGF